jgi:NAD(P)-dependent dehydrogenase (short-subunit alcohol dehydrogenase family)
VDNTKDLKDKTIVVTGVSSGIGRAALQALAARGARVIGVGRSAEQCRTVHQAVMAGAPHVHLRLTTADLASQRQVRQLASDIRTMVGDADGDHIDALIHGADVALRWREVTEEGYELQFAVNHLAPFLLTHELMPLLQAAPAGRIITSSSRAHRRGRIRWRDLMHRRRYSRHAAHRQSELANLLFTAELNRRLGEGSSVRAYAVDPGHVSNGVGPEGASSVQKLIYGLRRWRGTSQEQGVETIVLLATGPLSEHADRIYWARGRPARPSAQAMQREQAVRLWMISERLCGLGEDDAGSGTPGRA